MPGFLPNFVESHLNLARETGKPFRLKRPTIQRSPLAAERGYAAALVAIVKAIRDDINELLVPELGRISRESALRGDELHEDVKRRENDLLRNAVRRGELERPSWCQRCGEERSVEAHHPEYSKPIEVQWLCRLCHETVHGRGLDNDPLKKDVADVSAIIQGIKDQITIRVDNTHLRALEELVSRYADETSKFSRMQTARQIRRMIGFDAFPQEAGLRNLLNMHLQQNASLITTLSGDYVNKVSDSVRRNVQAGARPEVIARGIKKQFDVTMWRARFIARDQTNKLNGDLTRMRQTGLGIEEYVWRTSRDERVRPTHRLKEGNVYRWDDPPADTGHPGQDFNCLPGDTPAYSLARVVKAYRRRYAGELTTLVADTGESLNSTPNHPVLTLGGWKAAKDVQVGDYVFGAPEHSLGFLESNIKHRKTSIEQVFNLLSLACDFERVPGITSQFHGDGTNEQVDVIDVNRGSLADLETGLPQDFGELILAEADSKLNELPGFGDFLSALMAMGLPSNHIVRGLAKALAFGFGGLGHPLKHPLTTIPWLESIAHKVRSDGRPSRAKLFRKALNACARHVFSADALYRDLFRVARRSIGAGSRVYPSSSELGTEPIPLQSEMTSELSDGEFSGFEKPLRIVENLRRENYLGHVYNLETECGWYIAGTWVVGNCRCSAEPKLEGVPAQPEDKKQILRDMKAKRAKLRERLGPKGKGTKIARESKAEKRLLDRKAAPAPAKAAPTPKPVPTPPTPTPVPQFKGAIPVPEPIAPKAPLAKAGPIKPTAAAPKPPPTEAAKKAKLEAAEAKEEAKFAAKVKREAAERKVAEAKAAAEADKPGPEISPFEESRRGDRPKDHKKAIDFDAVDEWVDSSNTRGSVGLKFGAKQEFGLEGVPFVRSPYAYSAAELRGARQTARRMYDKTQAEFKRRKIKTIRLYRGINKEYTHQGAIESWTDDRSIAEGFSGTSGKVLVEDVPVSRILNGTEMEHWHNGAAGEEGEWLVMR